MDNALLARINVEHLDAELLGVFAEFFDHGVGEFIGEGFLARMGGNDVVHGGKGAVRVAHL